ncbi:hypothetical protein I7I48_11056 [Histoplasma ohiense]|nr:hypothetical protein I7I48_11056 [Histoplasma ohiense (nom. inval.)]
MTCAGAEAKRRNMARIILLVILTSMVQGNWAKAVEAKTFAFARKPSTLFREHVSCVRSRRDRGI